MGMYRNVGLSFEQTTMRLLLHCYIPSRMVNDALILEKNSFIRCLPGSEVVFCFDCGLTSR